MYVRVYIYIRMHVHVRVHTHTSVCYLPRTCVIYLAVRIYTYSCIRQNHANTCQTIRQRRLCPPELLVTKSLYPSCSKNENLKTQLDSRGITHVKTNLRCAEECTDCSATFANALPFANAHCERVDVLVQPVKKCNCIEDGLVLRI